MLHLFIGIVKADYEETDWCGTVAENKEQARENIINDFMEWDEIDREEAKIKYTIEDLVQLDEICGYEIYAVKK